MKLVDARITRFRSIDDSGEVVIDPAVTVLVGQNESGKTAFLKALHKSQPVERGVAFDVVEDYPRRDLTSYRKRHDDDPDVVASLTYVLDKEVELINKNLGAAVLTKGYRFTRTVKYDGKSTISTGSHNETAFVAAAIREIELPESVNSSAKAAKTLDELIQILGEADLNEQGTALLSGLTSKFGSAPASWSSALGWHIWSKHVSPAIPKFLYFDDYYLLPDKTNLQDLQRRVDAEDLRPEDETVLALLRMAEVDLEELVTAGRYEEVKANLEALSNSITDQIFEYWTQNKELDVEFDVRADPKDVAPFNTGANLYIRIRNRRHRVTVPFGQRSRGFIWFFSFLVWFDSVREQLGSKHDLILLLDEPGLNLHALAQADLLRYIDDLSEKYQTLYSTHSPFLVRGERLHQVRLVEDRDAVGTRVVSDISGSDPATVFPLQAALGYTIAQNLFISRRNVLVEGPADLVYLRFMSARLEAEGRNGLRDDTTIVPVGGLDKLATFVALLRGNELEMVVLHDSTGKPDQRLQSVVQEKLIRDRQLLNYGSFVNSASGNGSTSRAADVEDLFAPGEYLALFNRAFAKELGGTKLKISDLPLGDRIVDRISRHLESAGITIRPTKGFNHYAVANYLAADPPKKIDPKTLDRFAELFAAIHKAVGS
jgi:hypothetical protein